MTISPSDPTPPIVYEVHSADPHVLRFGSLLRAMARDASRSRYAGYRLFIKDIKAEYAQSAFGALWDFVDPLVLAAIFALLMRRGIIDIGELNMPVSLFAIYGVMIYQTFADSLIYTVSIIKRSKSLLSQTRVPAEALIFSSIYRALFFALFRITILLVSSLALYRSAEAQGLHAFSLVGFVKCVVLFPLAILPGIALGVLLAPFNVIYGDVERATRIMLQPLRYLSPVLWPIPWPMVNALNPIAPIIINLRLLATSNAMDNPVALVLPCAVSGIIFFAGWIVFRLSLPILAARN